MVARIMVQERFCEQCSQRHNCQDLYQKLGNSGGPSIVSKVVVAFIVPLLVFIICLAAFERILAEMINAERLRTALVFVLALSVTFLVILVVKVIGRRFGKPQ